MATVVEMNLPGYPTVVIKDRADAEQFVKILNRNGVAVNLRHRADKTEHDGVFPEGSEIDRAWQKANRGF